MPLHTGDKFAAIVFPRCRRLELPVPVQLTPELSAERGPVVELDDHWAEWLGKSRAEHLDARSLVLLAKRPSARPLVPDEVSPELRRSVQALAYACLLGGIPDYKRDALLLSGGVGPAGVEMSDVITLHTFFRQPGNMPLPVVDAEYARLGASRVDAIDAAFASTDLRRLRRGFNAWLDGVWEEEPRKRLHQFVRSLDGVLKLGRGRSRVDFIARCQAFATSANIELVLNELYELRSIEEHLNGWRTLLTGADGEARYLARTWQAERLARAAYGKLFETPALRASFADDATTEAFWAQPPTASAAAWNLNLDLDPIARETGYRGP